MFHICSPEGPLVRARAESAPAVTHMLSPGHMADMCATHQPSEYDKPQQIRIPYRAVLVIR